MKRNDIKQLHGKTIEQLTKDIEATQKKSLAWKLARKTAPEKNHRLGVTLSHDIARMKTVRHMLQLQSKEQKKV